MTADLLQDIARSLDAILNGPAKGGARRHGFVLLTFPFDRPEGTRVNYVSNAKREDIVVALKEVVARFEGQPFREGRA
ncbi:MAG TPA: hypothetical protein VLA52_14505 [Thermohalobaculum sp.]|nr:hypothetical protein [Thermohalobaculum sp.]